MKDAKFKRAIKALLENFCLLGLTSSCNFCFDHTYKSFDIEKIKLLGKSTWVSVLAEAYCGACQFSHLCQILPDDRTCHNPAIPG